MLAVCHMAYYGLEELVVRTCKPSKPGIWGIFGMSWRSRISSSGASSIMPPSSGASFGSLESEPGASPGGIQHGSYFGLDADQRKQAKCRRLRLEQVIHLDHLDRFLW